MSRSKTLFQLQEIDSAIDSAEKRIMEIDHILSDRKKLDSALQIRDDVNKILVEKQKALNSAETAVGDHNLKIDQNQKKLYSGIISNPKDLEDLQLESISLNKYLVVLEERQLEAMLEMEDAQKTYDQASSTADSIAGDMEMTGIELRSEKTSLQNTIADLEQRKSSFLATNSIPDLETYNSLRKSSGGIAVTRMFSESCSSCGASIPSAIAQEARSPTKLIFCPTCRRILHPG